MHYLYSSLDNWIPEEFPVIEVKRMAAIVTLQSIRDPMTQVNGFKAILNCKSNPIRHLRHCTPQNLYLLYHGCQNCLPARIHSYHLVNPSITSKICIEIMKHFFTEELKRKIHIHSSPEELLNFFPADILPTEYGGKLEDFDLTDWLKEVMQPEMLANLCGRPKSLS
ncbi:alpha-tocopherol transfer protein-like [Trichonephila clavata]|uniref:Alpha-tocopherol transfer protein-like n=1 Tax=Trichonephila clavata TaxID=2740835 RepID=A0A8X6KS07_TRICU|nr:alpha-tocopherol transfer protein-like [Trichonephila clavata]